MLKSNVECVGGIWSALVMKGSKKFIDKYDELDEERETTKGTINLTWFLMKNNQLLKMKINLNYFCAIFETKWLEKWKAKHVSPEQRTLEIINNPQELLDLNRKLLGLSP